MAAPQGNQFWRARTSHGRPPIYSGPDALWDDCCEYFDWVEANPLMETKAFHAQGIITTTTIPKMRAMTMEGLCDFISVEPETWRLWRTNRNDLLGVIARAERIIRRQKFEGAAADMLNPNIIARDLGLRDRPEDSPSDTIADALRDLAERLPD